MLFQLVLHFLLQLKRLSLYLYVYVSHLVMLWSLLWTVEQSQFLIVSHFDICIREKKFCTKVLMDSIMKIWWGNGGNGWVLCCYIWISFITHKISIHESNSSVTICIPMSLFHISTLLQRDCNEWAKWKRKTCFISNVKTFIFPSQFYRLNFLPLKLLIHVISTNSILIWNHKLQTLFSEGFFDDVSVNEKDSI